VPAPQVSCIQTYPSWWHDSSREEESHGKFDIPCWKAWWES
jgi:hypothetical protein